MAPTFSGPFNAAPALPVPAAAAINFQAETSYYAGSGLTVKF
jgi:hypothetical protein